MTFQTTVTNVLLNLGVPGDIILDEPHRIQPVTLDGTGGSIGNVFTKDATTGIATQGGAIGSGNKVFAGIAVLPKQEPHFGSGATDPLSASLILEPNSQVAMMTFGSCVANIPNAFKVGDVVIYNTTTGALASMAPNASLPGGYAQVPSCLVYGIPGFAGGPEGDASSEGGLAIIRLTSQA
ncbi:MAG TPA: hypothetical protein VFX20_13940 [Steroidobacteraceae bacterium]|nr:hypothetical protein [Steroidobacteraceae bacterium]